MSLRVSTSELQSTLERLIPEALGRPCRVGELRRRPSRYRTSFPLEEVDVKLDGDKYLELTLKDLGWKGLSAVGRRAKPGFLYDPLREITVYSRLLAGANLGAPRYYGSLVDPKRERYWLFVERVRGRELYQVGELGYWEQAARWLAAMHSRFAAHVERLSEEARLVRHDAAYYRTWVDRALEFGGGSAARSHEDRGLAWLADHYDGVVERLLAIPATVIHGEFYASNVLLAADSRIAPVDWELAAAGPGLIDLAALTTGWGALERVALGHAYQEAMRSSGAPQDLPEDLGEMLDLCRLHLAVQWLGWAPSDWTPPKEHRRDWLAEALELAEQLHV
jgi:Phosphotransferase enzyme family